MEAALNQYCVPLISLRTFLSEYQEIANELSIDFCGNEDEIGHMEEICSLDKLRCEDDPHICDYVPDCRNHTPIVTTELPANALKLETIKLLKKNKNRSVKNPFTRSRDIFKYVSDDPASTVDRLNFYNELVICVRMYRPARATHIGRTVECPVFAEEFVCLGDNYLTQLRDKISCICNGKRFFDISADPDQPIPEKKPDPGFFFITDTFYNDMRNENNTDYSTHIRKWAKQNKSVNQYKAAKMEDTKFIDLSVSLGAPQLYQHHGNCEHVFTISQVELLTPAIKYYARAEYPRCVTFNPFNNRPCQICARFEFIFVVLESDRQLHDPAYLCEECFKRYHYADSKKIGNFRAYRLKNAGVANAQEDNEEIDAELASITSNDEAAEKQIYKKPTQEPQSASFIIKEYTHEPAKNKPIVTDEVDGYIIELLNDE